MHNSVFLKFALPEPVRPTAHPKEKVGRPEHSSPQRSWQIFSFTPPFTFRALNPSPFEYKFLDDDFNSQYAADQKRGKIFAAFSILTIIITCLGLLGLTAFTTQQKEKEISIRRVMGASILQVVTLVTRSYLRLALASALIAFPVAWYFMHNWLKVFPYNDGLSAVPFLVSALVIVVTAAATAMFHSAKAALANPAKNLRTE